MLFLKIPAVKKKFNIPDQIIHTPEDFKPKGFREGWREGTFISNFHVLNTQKRMKRRLRFICTKLLHTQTTVDANGLGLCA